MKKPIFAFLVRVTSAGCVHIEPVRVVSWNRAISRARFVGLKRETVRVAEFGELHSTVERATVAAKHLAEKLLVAAEEAQSAAVQPLAGKAAATG